MKQHVDMNTPCAICNHQNWFLLPGAEDGRSVGTSGILFEAPLGKAQCKSCGVVQQLIPSPINDVKYYSQQYHTYFNRVGAENVDRGRYQATVLWMKSAIEGFSPCEIADVGCGRGWTMREMTKSFPEAKITGIEPSEEDSRLARENGLNVITSTLESERVRASKFDLVYCNNVVQHSISPREFLNNLSAIVKDDGVIVLTCPDSSKPNNEMMWGDQKFSFAPMHLNKLASGTGLQLLAWKKPPNVTSLTNKQLVVLGKVGGRTFCSTKDNIPILDITDNILQRTEYVRKWQLLDEYICKEIPNGGRIYNFGASMWSYLLRGYCPRYWKLVDTCIIDNCEGRFMEKEVVSYAGVNFLPDDVVVLGTDPLSQQQLEQNLKARNLISKIITWNQIVSQ